MIKQLATLTALLATSVSAQANAESNFIELLEAANKEGNTIELAVTGSNNALTIAQELMVGSSGSNVMNISINGDNNGGPTGASFTGVALKSGLQPGHLVQKGAGNSMSINVEGSSNLFSFLQNGTNNSLQARIQGSGNQAAVQQYGHNNHVSLSQTGSGNSIAISQRSF